MGPLDESAAEQAGLALRGTGIGCRGIIAKLERRNDPLIECGSFRRPHACAKRRRRRDCRVSKWRLAVDSAALVRDTIYRSTILLDQQQWNDWLAHCDDNFQYAIRAFS